MQLVILGVAVLALVSCATAGQRKPIEPLVVTKELVASQPAGQNYVIIPRSGAVYDVAPGIDYRRVRVRTSTGDLTLDEFVRRLGGNFTGQELLIGSLGDLVVVLPSDGSVSEAQCDKRSATCACTGRKDCSDLSLSEKCSPGPTDAQCGKGVGGGTGWGCSCQMKQ